MTTRRRITDDPAVRRRIAEQVAAAPPLDADTLRFLGGILRSAQPVRRAA